MTTNPRFETKFSALGRRRCGSWASTIAALWCSACVPDVSVVGGGDECKSDGGCDTCKTDRDCEDGMRCVQADNDAKSCRGVDECKTHKDCKAGQQCIADEMTGAKSCQDGDASECDTDEDCEAGQHCVKGNDGQHLCYMDTSDRDGDGIPDGLDDDPDDPCSPDEASASCSVNAYLSSLPTWNTFAYANTAKLPADGEGEEAVVEDSQTVEDVLDGDNLTKECTTERVSFYDTPSEYVLFSTPGILYPGALIQGKSLRDGADAGDLLPLNVPQRNTVRVSIPACAFAANWEEVLPNQAEVSGAIGAILDRAQERGVDCVEARGNLQVETFSSENQRALKAGISGRYLGYSASASGAISQSRTEKTVAALYRESLFTVQIQAPPTPSAWFSEEFTPDRLQEQVDLGKVGPDNIPAYVAEVTYGRMMMFTMTSEASEDDMRAYINFKYKNPVATVEGEVSATAKAQIEKAKYTASYLGEGSGNAWLKTLDWSEYFSTEHHVTASDAVPISFTLKSIRDDVPAMIQELTEYDRTTCVDKVAASGTFEFGDKQSVDTSFGAGVQTGKTIVVADLNGDHNDDIVWAATAKEHRGQVIVAMSNGDGTFTRTMAEHPTNPERDGDFDLLAGDVDGDGRDDLVLDVRGASGFGNYFYVIFYKPDGKGGDEFVYSAEQTMAGTGWQNYRPRLAQMDGVRGLDLVWNSALADDGVNRTYFANAVDMMARDVDLEKDQLFVQVGPTEITNVGKFKTLHVGDFDGDGKSDLVWQKLSADGNVMVMARSTGTALDWGGVSSGGVVIPGYSVSNNSDWSRYTSFVGDITGDGRADIIQPRTEKATFTNSGTTGFGYYLSAGTNTKPFLGGLVYSGGVSVEYPSSEIKDLLPSPDTFLADVDGNGRPDLIVAQRSGATNKIGVGLAVGKESPYLDFSRKIQSHPDTTQGEWGTYQVFVGNVDGDDGNNRDDVLWIGDSEPSIIYTGRARPSE